MLDESKIQLLQGVLGATSLRQRVIAGNIANQNTPGFTRQTVRFEDLVRSALENGDETSSIVAQIASDEASPAGPDGNNVSIEKEMNSLRENRLVYETYTTLLRNHFSLIEASIGR